MQHTNVVKKSLAFDIKHDFKQKSKSFYAYDDVHMYLFYTFTGIDIRSEQNPYEINYV